MKLTQALVRGDAKLILDAHGSLINVTDTLKTDEASSLQAFVHSGMPGAQLERLVSESTHPITVEAAELVWHDALLVSSKIFCAGLNYRDHLDERKRHLHTDDPPLAIFSKTPNTLAAPFATISVPGTFSQADWEGELAVIIGKRAKSLAAEAWREVVFGYTVANDLTERSLQHATSQWFAGKSLDGFCPFGPWVVLEDGQVDPHAWELETRVNGARMQYTRTDHMIYQIPELIAFISSFATLEPGDLILTGTPSGVGFHRNPPVFLRNGDVVDVEIESIGTLRNTIRYE